MSSTVLVCDERIQRLILAKLTVARPIVATMLSPADVLLSAACGLSQKARQAIRSGAFSAAMRSGRPRMRSRSAGMGNQRSPESLLEKPWIFAASPSHSMHVNRCLLRRRNKQFEEVRLLRIRQ